MSEQYDYGYDEYEYCAQGDEMKQADGKTPKLYEYLTHRSDCNVYVIGTLNAMPNDCTCGLREVQAAYEPCTISAEWKKLLYETQLALTAANKRVEILEQEVANQNKADFAIASSIRERAAKIVHEELEKIKRKSMGVQCDYEGRVEGLEKALTAIHKMEIP